MGRKEAARYIGVGTTLFDQMVDANTALSDGVTTLLCAQPKEALVSKLCAFPELETLC